MNVYDPADLGFWLPENWPGEQAPAQINVTPTGRWIADHYGAREADRPQFRGMVDLWVPDWLHAFYRDHEGVEGGSTLWWSSGATGTLEYVTRWCHREARDLEATRDRELARVRLALRQAPTVARLRGFKAAFA